MATREAKNTVKGKLKGGRKREGEEELNNVEVMITVI